MGIEPFQIENFKLKIPVHHAIHVHYAYGVYCLFMYTWITSNFCKLGFFWGAPKFAEARETLRLQKDWIFLDILRRSRNFPPLNSMTLGGQAIICSSQK